MSHIRVDKSGRSHLIDYTPPNYRIVEAKGFAADGKPWYRLKTITEDVSPLQGTDAPRFDDQPQSFPVAQEGEQFFK